MQFVLFFLLPKARTVNYFFIPMSLFLFTTRIYGKDSRILQRSYSHGFMLWYFILITKYRYVANWYKQQGQYLIYRTVVRIHMKSACKGLNIIVACRHCPINMNNCSLYIIRRDQFTSPNYLSHCFHQFLTQNTHP